MPHFDELYAQVNSPPPVFESTGVLAGGALSINSGDNTKFDMAAGIYAFADYTYNPAGPARSVFVKEAVTAQTVTNIGTQLVTYVGVDSNGDIIQNSVPFTNTERRTIAQVGVLVHTNLTNLNAVNDAAAPVREGISQLHDLMTALGAMNITGNEVSANGANLSINKSAGQIFKLGSTFQATPLNPHLIATAALVAPANMRYRLSNSTEFANTAVLDPTQYESSPGVLSPLSNPNKFSVQRVALFTSNLIRIQYGQAEYDTMADAGAAIAQNHFNTEANIAENGVLIGFVILRRSTTDLTNTADAKFIAVGKFGVQGGSVSALSSTDQLPEGVVNLYFTDARAQAAVVTASITNGDTTHSPSGDAVFDALALKQPLDDTLTGLAALSPTANQGIYATGADVFSTYSLTAGGRALGGVAGTADTFPYFSASNVVTLASITAAGLAILDDANAAAQRTTLGLGTGDTPTFTGVTTTGLATLAQAINTGSLQATKAVTTALTPQWQMDGSGAITAAQNSSLGLFRWSGDAAAPGLYLSKSRGATQGTHTVTQTSDVLGRLGFMGSDGSAFFEAARIEALVSSSPAAGSVPGMLVFSTTAIAGASATAALTLNNDQSALFGAYVTIPTTLVVGNTGAIPANTRVLIDRIGTGALPSLPGGTALTLQGNNTSTNNNYLVNIAGATGTAGIRFGDSASANQGRIDYDNATDGFLFFTNNAQAMSLSSAALLNTTALALGDGTLRAFRADGATQTANLQHNGTTNNTSSMCLGRWNATPAGPSIVMGASASSSIGTHALVANNTILGRLAFNGSDGAAFQEAARIDAIVNGTSGTNDMPGALRFWTTPDGSITPAIALTIGQDKTAAFAGAITGAGTARFNGATQGSLAVQLGAGSGMAANTARDDLVVDLDAAGGMSFMSPNNVTVGVAFGDTDSATSGQLRYNHSTDLMDFLTAGAVRLALDSTGAAVTGSVSVTGGISGANIYNTYTPTLTAVSNVSSTSASVSGWIRIGNAVLVFTRVSVTATASGTFTELRCSLPVASNFSATSQCVGVGGIVNNNTEVGVVGVQADTTNDEATLRFVSTSIAARVYSVVFGYIVI